MQSKHLKGRRALALRVVAAASALLASTYAARASAGQIVGNFSGVFGSGSSGVLQGWACETGNESERKTVELYLDKGPDMGGLPLASTVANVHWPEAPAAACNGQHAIGFQFALAPLLTRSRGVRQVYAAVIDSSGSRTLLPETYAFDFSQTFRVPAQNSVQLDHGRVVLNVDGSAVTGLGWTTLCPQRRSQAEINPMVGGSTFKMARLPFVLGDSTHHICATDRNHGDYSGDFQPTWDGRTTFDFTPLDREAARILQANPNTKIILQVALDGSAQWLADHPGNQVDPWLAGQGIPDYLSPEWRRDARMALQALIDHVRQVDPANKVVGYELFNGYSFDGNIPLSLASPGSLQAFRDYLRIKYQSDVNRLRQAWGDTVVDFTTAMPVLSPDSARVGGGLPFFVPARYRSYADTREFKVRATEQVYLDFAETVKTATNQQALVGVRGGEYLLASRDNTEAQIPNPWHTMDLYANPSIDFFEVWEHYDRARYFGATGGSGAPLMPVQGLASLGKHYVVQNDFRVPGAGTTDTNEGFGYVSDINAAAQKLRRVFANSLINGQSSYLFEMSYTYGQAALMSEWQTQEATAAKAARLDQHSVAEVAYVTDPETGQYFAESYESLPPGNQWLNHPGQMFYLMQYPMHVWARAGVPYDTIFLNQIETARPYKVYVFHHTIGMSADRIRRIQTLLQARHAVGIFSYADGLMDGQGAVDATQIGRNISALTTMTITGSMASRKPQMTPTAAFLSLGGSVGEPAYWKFPTDQRWPAGNPVVVDLFPSFTPLPDASKGEMVLATYTERPDEAAIVGKAFAGGGGIIYSASPYVPPGIIRWAAAQAGAFSYIDTEDAVFVNASLIGLYTWRAGTVNLRLPSSTVLYDLTRNVEYPAGTTFAIPVEADHTYVFYRGSANSWNGL